MFINETSTSVTLSVKIDQFFALNYFQYISVRWFHNGVLLPATCDKTSFNSYYAELTIDDPSLFDVGVYETQLTIKIYSKLTCDNRLPYIRFMGTSIVRSDVQHLIYGTDMHACPKVS